MNVYTSVIDLCAADVVADGTVGAADVLAFGQAFTAGAPAADVNHDQAVTADDATRFMESLQRPRPGGARRSRWRGVA
jgi:hypothetical protein